MNIQSINTPGSVVTFSNPTLEERATIIAHYNALRAEGHAFSISDEHAADNHSAPFIRVYHYATCVRCIDNAVEFARRRDAAPKA
jgi:hypothetical protein